LETDNLKQQAAQDFKKLISAFGSARDFMKANNLEERPEDLAKRFQVMTGFEGWQTVYVTLQVGHGLAGSQFVFRYGQVEQKYRLGQCWLYSWLNLE